MAALYDQSAATAHEDFLTKKLVGSRRYCLMDYLPNTKRKIGETTDYAEEDEIRKGSDSQVQRKLREKLIGGGIRAEKLHKDLDNLKNSRTGQSLASHEVNVKESTVPNTYYAQDGKVRMAFINPISDFQIQDQADPSKELIERPITLVCYVPSSWSDWESLSPSPRETNLPTEPWVHVNTELLELGLDKPLAVKWKNSKKWPDTLHQVDKLLAHISGRPDQQPYSMFGTAPFRSQPQWGDNGGEKHILQVDNQSNEDSVISPNSVPLASRSPTNASSKDGHSDKHPPPNKSPPYGLASSQAAEGQLCFHSLTKICLFLGAEVCVAAPLIRYNTVTSLSEDAKTLLFAAKFLGFAGFLFCLGACIFQRSRRAAGLMAVMGCAATFCGFLTILGTIFPENLMLWLVGALCVLPISAMAFAFKRFV